MHGNNNHFARVVVIGAGITGLACAHRLMRAGVAVHLFEGSDRPGGKVETLCADGLEFETGPNTLIANRRPTLDLLEELGLTDGIVDASPAAKRRYIAREDRLVPLPTNPIAALANPLLGPRVLGRAASDLWRSRGVGVPEDESVESFISRRFGRRLLDNLVAPFLTGVYAGDSSRLEARSVMPFLVEAEETSGSVIRGLIAARRPERGGNHDRLPTRSITFRGGLSTIPARLAEQLEGRLHLECPAQRLLLAEGGCRVMLETGVALACERVVVATPARTTAQLLEAVPGCTEVASGIARVEHAGLGVVGLVYERNAIPHPLDGFGYLTGSDEQGPVLGVIFRSSTFPHTAPPGLVLLNVFLGGMRRPECASWEDERLVDAARRDIERRLGAQMPPRRALTRRWRDAIPQRNRGYARLARLIQEHNASLPISVIGAAATGPSLNDCIAAGRSEADRLAELLHLRPFPAPATPHMEIQPCPLA